jgi:hypothetical protein
MPTDCPGRRRKAVQQRLHLFGFPVSGAELIERQDDVARLLAGERRNRLNSRIPGGSVAADADRLRLLPSGLGVIGAGGMRRAPGKRRHRQRNARRAPVQRSRAPGMDHSFINIDHLPAFSLPAAMPQINAISPMLDLLRMALRDSRGRASDRPPAGLTR